MQTDMKHEFHEILPRQLKYKMGEGVKRLKFQLYYQFGYISLKYPYPYSKICIGI